MGALSLWLQQHAHGLELVAGTVIGQGTLRLERHMIPGLKPVQELWNGFQKAGLPWSATYSLNNSQAPAGHVELYLIHLRL